MRSHKTRQHPRNNRKISVKALNRRFYNQKTLKVAKNLLGTFLVRKIGGKIILGMITETEAYCGPNDLASHASKGKTPRTQLMFGESGHVYVYLVYGMYYCLNIVTEKKDYPCAIFIRAVKIDGVDYTKTNGPGKLCKYLSITKKLNGIDITKKNKLWIEGRKIIIRNNDIKKTPRIGVDYAGAYKNKLWRFLIPV